MHLRAVFVSVFSTISPSGSHSFRALNRRGIVLLSIAPSQEAIVAPVEWGLLISMSLLGLLDEGEVESDSRGWRLGVSLVNFTLPPPPKVVGTGKQYFCTCYCCTVATLSLQGTGGQDEPPATPAGSRVRWPIPPCLGTARS